MTSGFRYDSPHNYHLTYSQAPNARRHLKLEIAGACLFIFVFFPAALWLFSFSDFPESSTSHRARGGITRLLLLIHVYLRFPLAVLAVLAMAGGIIAYVVRLADRRADFLFGPDGVAHVGLFVSKSLLWDDIGVLHLVHHQRRRLFLKPVSNSHIAEFLPKPGRGATVRARSKLAALLSIVQTNKIVIHLHAFQMAPDAFERTMLFLHPDLHVERKDRVIS